MSKAENDKDILYGMERIRPVVGGATEATILKWKREYDDFPIRKLGGQWVSYRTVLKAWFRKFAMGEIGPPAGKNH